MSSALSDNGVTNSGLVGVSSASQIDNSNNLSVGNSANASSANDEWLNAYKRDRRANAPAGLDGLTGYDRQFDNAKYQQGLSDTSIQRRVADSKLAGINPLFSIGPAGGASSGISWSNDTSNQSFSTASNNFNKAMERKNDKLKAFISLLSLII